MLQRPIKRISVIALIIIAVTLVFWLGSRYPDLNAKAMMANSGSVEDTISVWPVLHVKASMPLVQKILYSTVNWVHNNLKGMTFGVIFGGCAFALLPLLQIRAGGNRFANAFYGMLVGTPLGVCVNCAAPVFKGVLQSRRLELAFSMMLSSPTLNIVVLTMVFSLFPWHLALIKLFFTFFMVLLIVPLLSWILRNHSHINDWNKLDKLGHKPENTSSTCILPNEPWITAMIQGIKDVAKGILYIGVRTVPLMLVAGFIGASISQIIPFSLYTSQPSSLSILLIAGITTLLPVPVAFDVILSNAMYVQGLSISVVAMLLSGLGIFSVYSFFIVWTSASRLWASALLLTSFLLTTIIGFSAPILHKAWFVDTNIDNFQAMNSSFEKAKDSAIDRESISQFEPPQKSKAQPFEKLRSNSSLSLLVKSYPSLISASNTTNEPSNGSLQFTQLEGFEIGITRGFRYGIRDYTDPFWVGRGTGTGDIDQNGWPDLVLGSSRGPQVYLNHGGWFERQDMFTHASKPPFATMNTYVTALVDMNNDGWLDLFITTYESGNFIIYNDQGKLNPNDSIQVPNNDALLTISPGFHDFDRNGYLDVLNGNMALGVVTASQQLNGFRQNSLTFIEKKLFRQASLSASNISGETMSTLIADLNNDHHADIYLSNDFIVPDRVLLGHDGGFKEQFGQSFIEATPTFSMSSDVGDFNNDLIPDLLSMGTIMRQPWVGQSTIDNVAPEEYKKQKWHADTCHSIKNPLHKNNCLINRGSEHILDVKKHRNWEVVNCNQLPTNILKQQCLITTMWFLVTNNIDYFNCNDEFNFDKRLLKTCKILKQRGAHYEPRQFGDALIQGDNNFLYQGTPTGQKQVDASRFKHPGGWTWNGKFIDLDNDGWQDIFNVESSIREQDYGWNVAMKNEGGKSFKPVQFSWNLTNDFGLFSYVAIDYDLDGDLDIIGNSAEGPVQVYNNPFSTKHKSITISLLDKLGNSSAVGSKVVISYRDQEGAKQQARWIKASGGYQSFDGLEAHFGLGKQNSIDAITIIWPDAKTTQINGPLEAGKHYKIERRSHFETSL